LSKQYHQISVSHEDRPGKPLSDLRLVAVVGTWHEADIVQATVMNCFTQGCDEVLIVDNDSPDNTCLLAEQAGAKIADVFRTDYYLEAVRLHRINRVFVEAAKRHAGNDLWCLAIDADELPQGHSGKTLRQMLRDFGRAYDTVGAVAFDHYPTGEPENVLGKHPADYQPMGMFRGRLGSNEGYWKHPLVFYPAGAGWQNCFSRGMHLPYSLGMAPLRSPVKPILIHHFPFRGRRETYLRLTRLCKDQNGQPHRSVTDDRDISGQGAIRRYRHLDDVYAQRWERIRIPHDQGFSGRLEVKHWSAYFSPEDYEPKRWYM
jgi:glycosyltransferase involved in cell wall biosynthesis